jgi:hypothetical protein
VGVDWIAVGRDRDKLRAVTFRKRGGISWLAEEALPSEERPCSMNLLTVFIRHSAVL